MKDGSVLQSLNSLIDETVAKAGAHPSLKPYAGALAEAKTALLQTTAALAQRSRGAAFLTALGAATPFLELFGDVVLAWLLLWQAAVASAKMNELLAAHAADTPEKAAELMAEDRSAAFYAGKTATAAFYIGSLLPRTYGKVRQVMSEESQYLTMPENAFVWEA